MKFLSPVANKTLADIVTDRIREAIVKGELLGGERLTEPNLAEVLEVSRSPVREALVRLESEGLVFRDGNHGVYVWTPTETDVDEILSLRVMIETLAAEICISKLTDEDYKKIDIILEEQRRAIKENDYLHLIIKDREFHDYFLNLTNHSRLIDIWKRFMSQWQVLMYRRFKHYPYLSESVLIDHKHILEAFRNRDLEKIKSLHREINHRVGRETKSILPKLSTISDNR